MIHTKRVIFMILPLLFVPFVYGMSSTPDACAVPPHPNYGKPDSDCYQTFEDDLYFVTCCWTEEDLYEGGYIQWCQTCDGQKCTPPERKISSTDPLAPLQDGISKQLPTPPPTRGEGLFGSEVLPTPPAGLAPPTEPPAPTSEPTAPPETGQGQEDGTGGGNGGIKPPVKDLLPETGIEEQPEVQQPEGEPSNEGQGPAGPLT